MQTLRAKLTLVGTAGLLIALISMGFSKSVNSIGLGICAAALLLRVISGEKGLVEIPYVRVLIAFALFLAIDLVVNHQYFWTSVRGLWKYMGGFLTMVLIMDALKDKKNTSLLLYTLLAAYGFSAFTGLWQKFTGFDLLYFRPTYAEEAQVRLSGSFKHYNDYGTFLMTGVVVSLAYLVASVLQKKKIQMICGVILFSALSYVLINTFSRSAFVAAIFALTAFCAFFRTRKFSLPVLVIGITLLILFYPPFGDRLKEAFSLTHGTTGERLMLANTGLKMIRHSPIFGLGINTYSIYFPQFRPEHYESIMYAHNSYLQIGSEIGLVGLSLFLLYVVLCLKDSLQLIIRDADSPALTALRAGFFSAIFGLLVNSCFESLLQSTLLRSLFWTLLGFLVATARFKSDSTDPAAHSH